MNRVQMLWHSLVLRHSITRYGRIPPSYRQGGINVYVQDQFRPPMAHHDCSCGKTWTHGSL